MANNNKEILERNRALILECLAKISIEEKYDLEIPIEAEDEPLADILVAVKIAADSLKFIAQERDKTLASLQEKLETIEKQRQAILELSTPVIQIWDEILVMPLIGTIDTRRARQILEDLLQAIVQKQATVVIIDVTGVPVVDTKVANHFLKTIDAAKMLGASVILTGVNAHNAQTLVKLGVNLSGISTQASLQAGLLSAFRSTNHVIAKVD